MEGLKRLVVNDFKSGSDLLTNDRDLYLACTHEVILKIQEQELRKERLVSYRINPTRGRRTLIVKHLLLHEVKHLA